MNVVKIIGKIMSYVMVTVLFIVVTLLLTLTLICKGPSKSARELFSVTILETGQLKFLANIFFSKEELDEIIAKKFIKRNEC
jgi:hypothetical protein